MGRKRSYRNRHLPPNLHPKHGAWYLVKSTEGRQQLLSAFAACPKNAKICDFRPM